MIWATWRTHRSVLLTCLGVAIAFAIWLAVIGSSEIHSWAIFVGHHCSVDYPGRSEFCMTSLGGFGNFSRINAGLCAGLPALLGLVLGVSLVAGEIQQHTNRLAWTQSITRTRWLLIKVGVVALFIAVLVGALVPLFWWWSDAAHRTSHIQPANFDGSGFVVVAYALSAFVLGAFFGAVIRKSGWALAVATPVYVLLRVGVQLYIRPSLIAPITKTTDAFRISHQGWWYLNGGFVPNGRSTPAPGQSWSSNESLMESCQDGTGYGKPAHSAAYCEKLHHFHYVLQFQPPSHFWPLQTAESAIFLGIAAAMLALTVLVVGRWRT